jgi:eukaryotic-like serine/threonine-protein kinase
MREGFLWCPHCGRPHKLGARFCGETGKALEQRVHRRDTLPARRHPLVGHIIDNKYEILRRIGVGGMGEVFEAENRLLHRQVAIKIVNTASAEAAARLRREAEVITTLQHPNICDVYDVGTLPDGSPYLVLERLTGETLEDHLRRERRMSSIRAIELFMQILSGLQHAHAVGIVHRDLKPANVFLAERVGCPPLVKLLDFGFAKDVSGRLRTMTRPGNRCGTPAYMSPEQLFGRPLDLRSDVFSVGIMLFEVLCSRHPFAGASVTETTIRIAREPPSRFSRHVPRDLADVVMRALEKDPSHRPQSALEMQTILAALEELEETDPGGESDSHSLPRLANSGSTPLG